MSHVFKNLEELAAELEERASHAAELRDSQKALDADFHYHDGVSSGYLMASHIVRHTTITEDVSCREI